MDNMKITLELDTEEAKQKVKELKDIAQEVNEELEKALFKLGLLKEEELTIKKQIKN